MASISFIEKRVTGKQKELDKLTKKMERIKAAEATDWEKNPYYYSEYDLRSTAKDIEEATAALAKYQAELQAAVEKANSRNVPAILEFLGEWKARCLEFYGKGLREAFDEQDAVNALYRKAQEIGWASPGYDEAYAEYQRRAKAHRESLRGRYEKRTMKSVTGRTWTEQVKVETGALEYVAHFMRDSYEESMDRLAKILEDDANAKYDFIIERTNAIVGEITDAAGLRVGDKGDLNGIIIGTKGRAKVQTIGAGGYNIQIFHFRTLIHAA